MESQTPELPPLDPRRSVSLEAMRYVMSWPTSYIEEYAKAAIAAAVLKERAECAALCDATVIAHNMAFLGREARQAEGARNCAAAIRARADAKDTQ